MPFIPRELEEESPSETVIVYPPGQGSAGTSIYGKGAIIQMAKMLASWGNSIGMSLAGGHLFFSAGWKVVGSSLYTHKGASGFANAMSGAHAGTAGIIGGMAAGYGALAAHPPRENYKVSPCAPSFNSVLPDIPKGMDELKSYVHHAGEIARSVWILWDSAELFDGAALQNDGRWMEKHYKSSLDAYKTLYYSTQKWADLTYASFERSLALLETDPYRKTVAKTESPRIKRLCDVEVFEGAFKSFEKRNPCLQGALQDFSAPIRAARMRVVDQDYIQVMSREALGFARALHRPVERI